MNFNKLKGKIVERQLTYQQCADAIEISTASFSNKMNGSKRFWYDEISKLSDLLDLSNDEKIDIFLS
ncbi:MAG: DUF739 family protein [bacterium]|nr:DUF739 family protein [bacterium]